MQLGAGAGLFVALFNGTWTVTCSMTGTDTKNACETVAGGEDCDGHAPIARWVKLLALTVPQQQGQLILPHGILD